MFSVRLTSLRKKRNVTQQRVADFLGITRPAYTAYEQGKRQPDYETLQKIAKYFDVSIDYLLTGNEYRPEESIRFDELHFHGIDKLSKEEIEDVKKQALERIEYHLWKKERQGNKNNE
ncbi:helix-turn-helix domain-containing protein [Priestia filamentosa]|uniref:helix-turn-helix domain-containing protein n=1 Tax=Priestia filamentosa TaxID=1402861 RepID=UPI000A089783|nr:helix-turn-helix transcriptional regulator [Priestia filamentosa]OXS69873.1 hypothetical protein B1B01_13050 [Priestia filamentosa]SMF37433.1 DNA-binding transcriptional regulator, XRE-family HTH domain [Priestia filamentosa]